MVLPLLAACGGNGQISVNLAYADPSQSGPFKPGDTPQFVLTVTNNGPGDAPGVEAYVDLPSTFHYKTSSISGFGDARTQPLDARVGSATPEWGFWDLAAPVSNANGCESCVTITFTSDVAALPGNYSVTGHAQGDNTAGDVPSNTLALTVAGAPDLGLSARVQAGPLRADSSATYVLTITNTGTGPATDVSLLVTLPPAMVFYRSVTPFEGNASRSKPVDPVAGSVEVFYSGWTLPGSSSAGPGFITVVFVASVVNQPASGAYTITAQVSDAENDLVTLTGAAPVHIIGTTPSPGPAITAQPTFG